MAAFMERLAFLQKVPTLMKATADDENPCPGYLFLEISKISHESAGFAQCLLEYLLDRLQVESCFVKLKVLKIFVHLCSHGSDHLLTELRRNSTFIQQASVYSGPPDPIHGTALYQKVRNTAQEVARLLFTDSLSNKTGISPLNLTPPTIGMGSSTVQRSGMQGFGYSPGKQGTGTDSLLGRIQKAAEVVASAVLPPTEHQGIRLHDNHYRAVAAPPAPIEVAVPACAYSLPARRPKAVTPRCPGQVGGAWEETDSCSSQDTPANSRTSVGSKSAGTDSQSGASRESSGDLSERVEALQLGDCGQEVALISRLTEGGSVFLSREENQHFIKECSTLNCEVVVELLCNKLQDPSVTVQMRALCAIACLMTSDLLSLEQMFAATQKRLGQLSEGPEGPVANKATKILLQFEALLGGSLNSPQQDPANSSRASTSLLPASTPPPSDPLEPTLSHLQPGGSDSAATPSPCPLTRRDSSGDLVNVSDEVKLSAVRTPDVDPELTRSRGSPPPTEETWTRSSLFEGMELVVTKARPPRDSDRERSQAETKATGDDSKRTLSDPHGDGTEHSGRSGSSKSGQSVSAFSFVQC